jgi:hypothetical protein
VDVDANKALGVLRKIPAEDGYDHQTSNAPRMSQSSEIVNAQFSSARKTDYSRTSTHGTAT